VKIALLTSNQPRHIFFIKNILSVYEPSLIICEKKEESYFIEDERKYFGSSNNISTKCPVMVIKKGEINSDLVLEKLKKLKIDLCLVFGTSLIKEHIFKIPKKGCINIHTGLVQRFRGVDSCYWAIYEKKPEYIGATIHTVASKVDNGEVLIQKRTELNKKDTIESIFFKTCKVGIELLKSNILAITKENYIKKSVHQGKLYQNKNMNNEVKQAINKIISEVINNYLNEKQNIDRLQEINGAHKWKLL